MINNKTSLFYNQVTGFFILISFTSFGLLDKLLIYMHIHLSRFQLTCISVRFPLLFSSDDSHLLCVRVDV